LGAVKRQRVYDQGDSSLLKISAGLFIRLFIF